MECLESQCQAQYHLKCLAESGLKHNELFPSTSTCKVCNNNALWGDLVRRQRCLIAIEKAKPVNDSIRLAEGMIPKDIQSL
jgi:hypothetical protein